MKFKVYVATLVALLISTPVLAVLDISITEGVDSASPIAIIPFKWSKSGQVMTAAQIPPDSNISKIVALDLARSGKFSPMPETDLIARPSSPEDMHFNTWRVAGIDHVVIGSIDVLDDDTYQVKFRLYDVFKNEQVLGYSIPATNKTLRSVAHRISDYILETITGLEGAFDSRIVYVTSKQENKKITYRLQVADTDGFNPQTLLTSDEPIMSPTWSPDGSRLVYVSFEGGQSAIYVHNIYTAQREKLSSFKGINGAPEWSPDGTQIALTLSKDGNPDVYIMSLAGKKLKRLTKHWGIDTEATWMPDGKALVFTSSRSGKPQLYKVLVNGKSRPQRLTFEGNYNANANVSRDGTMITFVQNHNNAFKVAVLHIKTGLIQALTNGPLDESPEFSPNGNMILYASQNQGQAILAAVSTDGRHKHQLMLTDGEVREPSWASSKNASNKK